MPLEPIETLLMISFPVALHPSNSMYWLIPWADRPTGQKVAVIIKVSTHLDCMVYLLCEGVVASVTAETSRSYHLTFIEAIISVWSGALLLANRDKMAY